MEQRLALTSEMAMARHPDTVLAEASLVARSVDRLVRQRPDLVQVIGGRRHPRFELLQIVASMFRVTARIRETRRLHDPDGWEAVAEAYHVPSGSVVAVADGMCTRDEPSWDVRPKYEWRSGPNGREKVKVGEEPVTSHQRRSMAQTRASSKALRLALGWVLGLAGYEATAAEEMPDADEEAPMDQPRFQPRRKSQAATESATQSNGLISTAQQRRLWAIAREAGLTPEDVAAVLRAKGYDRTEQIRLEDYDAIIALIRGNDGDK